MTFEQALAVLAQPRQNNGKQEQEALMVVKASAFQKPKQFKDDIKVSVDVTVFLDDVENEYKQKLSKQYNVNPDDVHVTFKDVKVQPTIEPTSQQGATSTSLGQKVETDENTTLVEKQEPDYIHGHRFIEKTTNWKDGSLARDPNSFLFKFIHDRNISVHEAANKCNVSQASINRMCAGYKVTDGILESVYNGLNLSTLEKMMLKNSLTKKQVWRLEKTNG